MQANLEPLPVFVTHSLKSGVNPFPVTVSSLLHVALFLRDGIPSDAAYNSTWMGVVVVVVVVRIFNSRMLLS